VAMVAARGRPTVMAPALFRHGKEEEGRRGRVGKMAEWANNAICEGKL
jgi:hypothetical protein